MPRAFRIKHHNALQLVINLTNLETNPIVGDLVCLLLLTICLHYITNFMLITNFKYSIMRLTNKSTGGMGK